MKRLRPLMGFMSVILLITVIWSIMFFIVSLLFDQPFTENLLRNYGQQLLTLYATKVIFILLMMFLVGKRQYHFMKSMVDAMKRIAKGDFSVSLSSKHPPRWGGEFGIQITQNFNQMVTELGQMEQLRQEFISNVSHEIQSPLTSIRGFARALQNEALDPETRQHYLAIIEKESERLSKLSDNLLKLTSLESKHHPFEPQSYRLDQQLRNAILACEPQWLGKEIHMDVSLEKVTIVADEDLMSQVWMNLLHNSIKFTPYNGAISVRLYLDGEHTIVQISDTGIGIAEEDQERIFERFFKADPSRNRANGGSGLGLSIVKKIVELHEGSIEVKSRLGEGTTFTLRLPLNLE